MSKCPITKSELIPNYSIFNWLLFITLCFAFSAFAEETAPTLALDECIKQALANNPKLIQAMNGVEVNRAGVGEARSEYLPKATTTVSYARASRTAGFIAASGLAVKGNTYTTQTGLEQLIWDFGKTLKQMKLAKQNLTSAELAFLDVQEETILKVKEAYFETLKAQASVDVARENLKKEGLHLEEAKGFYEVGFRQKFDVTKQEVLVSNATLECAVAKKDYESAKVKLNNAIGRMRDRNYRVEEAKIAEIKNPDEDEALKAAMKNRAAILEREAEAKAAEMNLDVEKKGNLPKITMDLSHGARKTETADTTDSVNFGVLFKWPWFDGFKTQSQIESARANLNIAKSNVQEKILDVAFEVQDAVLGMEEASERIKSTEKSLQEAKEQLEIMDARQSEGLSSPIEVADAKYSVVYAGSSHVIAVSDYMIAQAKYERAVGIIMEHHAE